MVWQVVAVMQWFIGLLCSEPADLRAQIRCLRLSGTCQPLRDMLPVMNLQWTRRRAGNGWD
jgi:hypothetical protein